MTMLPKPQAIDSSVTMLGRANLARRRRCWCRGFKWEAIKRDKLTILPCTAAHAAMSGGCCRIGIWLRIGISAQGNTMAKHLRWQCSISTLLVAASISALVAACGGGGGNNGGVM